MASRTWLWPPKHLIAPARWVVRGWPLLTTIIPSVKNRQIVSRRKIEPKKRFWGPHGLRSKPWWSSEAATVIYPRFVPRSTFCARCRFTRVSADSVGCHIRRHRPGHGERQEDAEPTRERLQLLRRHRCEARREPLSEPARPSPWRLNVPAQAPGGSALELRAEWRRP